MSRPLTTLLLASALYAGPPGLWAQASGADPLVGTWVGELALGAVTVHIVFNVSDAGGSLSATMDSPDQGAKGIPVSAARDDRGSVSLEVKSIGGVYRGTLAGDASRVEGQWAQGGATTPVVLKRWHGPFVVDRPQEPKPPFPYREVEVSIPSANGVVLAGTVAIPPGPGPFAAVVLVTGSGPQNRDEELMGHKPFLVISDYLARRGIEVLRFDDRGVARSTGTFGSATTFDFADDAEAALVFLAARPEVDRARVGIAGHSEGALDAAIAAARNPAVRFIILLAGPGVRGDQLLPLQAAAIGRAGGQDEATLAAVSELNRRLYDLAESENDPAVLVTEGRAEAAQFLERDTRLPQAVKDELNRAIGSQMAQLATPWVRTFLRLDPADYLSQVKVPVLALNGSKDLQVPSGANLAAVRSALDKAGNPRSRVVELPGLNHLFQHTDTGLPAEYGRITETFAPEALAEMESFIRALPR